jgi:hypothetical protein
MRNLPIKSKACQLSLPFGVQYRQARDAKGILQKVLIAVVYIASLAHASAARFGGVLDAKVKTSPRQAVLY